MVCLSRSLLTFAAARTQGRLLQLGTTRPCAAYCNMTGDRRSPNQFEVLGSEMAYSGWRNILKKTVRIDSERNYVFDVVHQDDPSVAVFVWHTESKTLTLIREFAPGREEVAYGVVAGLFEKSKHETALQAAQYELEEEAHLLGGTWYPLCDNAETSINADKYSTNEFFCWLVVDPEVTSTPRDMDDEEFIEIERGVSMQTAMAMLSRGEMSAVSGFILLMAERKLRQLGFLNGNY